MAEFLDFVRSLWVVWLMALFLGLVAWTLWPKRRHKLEEEYSRIPLRDDEPQRDDEER